MKIIVASNNQHKISEIKAILGSGDNEVVSLKEAGINIDVVEDGKTFEENALKKATEIYKYVKNKGLEKDRKFCVLADDSGLEGDFLKGAPGVYSARYAGNHGDDKANNAKLLSDLAGVDYDKRSARFVCSMVMVCKKNVIKSKGVANGFIIMEEKGFEGFGYDPLFFSSDLNKTFAEASSLEKNSVSHRARALIELKKELKKI